jgi:hypothetical protein
MRDKQAREADYKRRLEEAEAGLAAADASAAQWERNLLAFKPVPAAPEAGARHARRFKAWTAPGASSGRTGSWPMRAPLVTPPRRRWTT